MATNSWFSIKERDDSSSTKVAWDNGGGGFLKARVSRQELGSKEKEDKRSLNRFYSDKNGPPGPLKARCENATVHLLTQLK